MITNKITTEQGSATRKKILEAIVWYIQEHGYSPTVREIGDMVGLKSTATVHRHLKVMMKERVLETDSVTNARRAIRVVNAKKTNADSIREMGNEELAKFLYKVYVDEARPCMTGEMVCKWEDYPTHDKGCKDCFAEWLKKEIVE